MQLEYPLHDSGSRLVWIGIIADDLGGKYEHTYKEVVVRWPLCSQELHLEPMEEYECHNGSGKELTELCESRDWGTYWFFHDWETLRVTQLPIEYWYQFSDPGAYLQHHFKPQTAADKLRHTLSVNLKILEIPKFKIVEFVVQSLVDRCVWTMYPSQMVWFLLNSTLVSRS